MYTILSFLTLTHTSLSLVHGFPSLNVDRPASESKPKLEPRPNIPEIPPKPATSGSGSFHGSQFLFLEQTDYAPAVDAMPVWVYSRTQKEFSPCAPEGGTDTTGKGPNPGTNIPSSASPGEDCTDVGPDPVGPYTLANAFPTYVGAVWCGDSDEWRIQYYNYYVDGDSDVSNEATGLNRRHPKVYVGFFSHASFPEINKSRKTVFNVDCPATKDLLGNEYRSNDWWRLPRREDIRPASDIDPDWDYGDATSDPGTHFENICK
ncbi:MAG: hypothetical protein Q9205_002937, partial [Flavoplaca limonia]